MKLTIIGTGYVGLVNHDLLSLALLGGWATSGLWAEACAASLISVPYPGALSVSPDYVENIHRHEE